MKSPLRLLEACCRQTLRVKAISPRAPYYLVSSVRPTLLLDHHDGDAGRVRAAKEILRADGGPGSFSIHGNEAHELHFAKVLCSRYPIGDLDLASKGIQVLIPFDVRPRQSLDRTAIQAISDELVPQLFAFRLQNYYRVLNEQILNTGGLNPATKELANAWAAPMLGDKGLLEKLLPHLEEHDRLFLMEREMEPEWLAVKALLDCCHNVVRPYLSIKEVAARASYYGKQGGGRTLTPKATGLVVRALGIKPQNRRGDGTRILFTERVKERIHLLAFKYGITRGHILNDSTLDAGYGGPPCTKCDRYGRNTDPEGSRLKCADLYPPRPKSQTRKETFADGTSYLA